MGCRWSRVRISPPRPIETRVDSESSRVFVSPRFPSQNRHCVDFASLTLAFRDGTPVALQAGSIRPLADPDALPQAFFTNLAGRFRIDKLKPGRYTLEVFG